MCNTKRDILATDPKPKPHTTPKPSSPSSSGDTPAYSAAISTSLPTTDTVRTAASSSSSTSSSHFSLGSLKDSLPEAPNIYRLTEICSATNNFLSKRLSSSASSSWRCSLRGKDTVVFQRRFWGDPARLRDRLAATCKIHHSSIARVLGASLGGDYIYLVYEYVNGASLADCLRNPRNPNYTPLATWISRMQVATDLAQGLEYIHHYTTTGRAGTPSSKSDRLRSARRLPVHSRIKSSSVMITDPQFRAKICHFGAAELAGETTDADTLHEDDNEAYGEEKITACQISEISEDFSPVSSKLRRSDSRRMKFEGTRGYIAPEILAGWSVSQKSDVFAFGVVLLELLTGQEPLKYTYDRERKDYKMVSLIEMARDVVGSLEEEEEEEGEGEEAAVAEERHRRIRRWVDRRLKDSFPVGVAVRAARVALECVRAEAGRRPDMVRVAGKVSRLFLESKAWADKVSVPTDFTVSMAPR